MTTYTPTLAAGFTIQAKAAGAADVFLYGEIGGGGVRAADFMRELTAIKASRINLYLNSPGGAAHDGIAMYNALRRHPARVRAVVDGIAASAASVVAMAGDTVVMARGSSLLIHDAWGVTIGNADEHGHMLADLDRLSDQLADIYAARAGGSREQWRDRMRVETTYTAEEAILAGLADEIEVVPANAYTTGKIFALSSTYQHGAPTATTIEELNPDTIALIRQLQLDENDPEVRRRFVAASTASAIASQPETSPADQITADEVDIARRLGLDLHDAATRRNWIAARAGRTT